MQKMTESAFLTSNLDIKKKIEINFKDEDLSIFSEVLSHMDNSDFLSALKRLPIFLYDNNSDVYSSLTFLQKDFARYLNSFILDNLRYGIKSKRDLPSIPVKFGTSGWRGLLYDDFTMHTVACVTLAVIDTVFDENMHCELGVSSIEDIKKRGCVLAHDTRLCGEDFLNLSAILLLKNGIHVIRLDMATTPEVSQAIYYKSAAFSINFTPSHNPFTYHGYKFNPSDGGPASSVLTSRIANKANEILNFFNENKTSPLDSLAFAPNEQLSLYNVSSTFCDDESRDEVLDPIETYKKRLSTIQWFSLESLVDKIKTYDVHIYIDNGFGATIGKYQKIFDGVPSHLLHFFNSSPDYLFGGKNCEPSIANFNNLQQVMNENPSKYVLGFMNDGDGDRFIGGGKSSVLVMNMFGPLVIRYLSKEHGITGSVARSVMTSHIADSACKKYLPNGSLIETPVGFQHFRPHIKDCVACWEESDGMTINGWSYDKDGILAALIFTDMILHYQTTPEALFEELQNELGYYNFERQKVEGNVYGANLVKAIKNAFCSWTIGARVYIGGRSFKIEKIVTLDGFKFIFENGWWVGIRASGTEPITRIYVETFAGPDSSLKEREDSIIWKDRIVGAIINQVKPWVCNS